jgi:hypothetical protein
MILFVKTHGQSGYDTHGFLAGLIFVEKKPGRRQSEETDEIGDHAILVKRETHGVGLLFGKIAHKIGLPIHRNVEIFGEIAILEIDPELDFRGVPVYRFKNDGLFAVGRFGETEPDIDAYGLHNASVMV